MTVNEDLLNSFLNKRNPVYRIYDPDDVCIVLGAGRKNKGDIFDGAVKEDSIPVFTRKGGGGTVVLSPGMIVLALVAEVSSPFHNREYACRINTWQKQVLEAFGIRNIRENGISDLTLGGRKILGTSIFRRKNLLFYQSSLLVKNDLSLFSRYLSFPSSVPDYRGNRDHEEFCTNLHNEGYRISVDEVSAGIERIVSIELPLTDKENAD